MTTEHTITAAATRTALVVTGWDRNCLGLRVTITEEDHMWERYSLGDRAWVPARSWDVDCALADAMSDRAAEIGMG